jgi:hypothetical protein
MTRSQIIEHGITIRKKLWKSSSKRIIDIYNNEEIVRTRNIDEYPIDTPTDKSTQTVLPFMKTTFKLRL